MRLSGIFLYPVKSLAGISVLSAELDALGLVVDRPNPALTAPAHRRPFPSMKTLRPILVFSGLVTLAVSSATADTYERFGQNDRQLSSSYPTIGNRTERSRPAPALRPLTVGFTITANGEATAIHIVKSSGDASVDAQCVAALQSTPFEPKRVDAVAVSSEKTVLLSHEFVGR